MQCEHARDLLGAYVDGELTSTEHQMVVEHLMSCAACARDVDDLRHLGQQIRATGREVAPAGLALRIRAELAKERMTTTHVPSRLTTVWHSKALRQTAALAAACVLSSLITWTAITWQSTSPRLESDVVSAHIRSLLQDSPIQVASSDSHTVKPWFTGRIDFSPEVKNFAAEGFPLVGGRIDYVGDRRVGAVVYKRNLHVVNVFMWPAASADPIGVQRHVLKGYNVLHWSKGGVTYWAVSDLNADELRQLQGLL